MRIQVRRRRERSLVGVEVEDRVLLDEEVDADTSSAPADRRDQQSLRTTANRGDSRPHVHVALPMLRLVLAIHAAEALMADHLSTKQAQRRLRRDVVAALALPLEALRRERIELHRKTYELVDSWMLEISCARDRGFGEGGREGR